MSEVPPMPTWPDPNGSAAEWDQYLRDIETRSQATAKQVNVLRGCCRPAKASHWAAWLRTWMDAGNEASHYYDYSFSRVANSWLVLNEPPKVVPEACGAQAVHVIVPAFVPFAPGDLDGVPLGHCSWYFFGAGETEPVTRGNGWVPMYTDVSDILMGAS